MWPAYTIYPLGDSALTIDFGNRIDEGINTRVLELFSRLQKISPFIYDIIPAYSSLTVCYNATSLHTNEETAFEKVSNLIRPLIDGDEPPSKTSRQLKIPVCYSKNFGLDLDEIAADKNISVEELIQLHTAKVYRVYMIGFLPGFAYMGSVDERIATPRKKQPRTNVEAGSVGIAGEQTGIYPLSSPGGWNIIGRTPVRIFDVQKEEAVLFEPGDEVSFYSITEDEFENYKGGNY